jgi:predicted transcriptional regulator
MADGELTLKLDDETARRLREAADAAGRPIADYAADLLARNFEQFDAEWDEAYEALAEFDRTGESVPLDEALARARAVLDGQLARRR